MNNLAFQFFLLIDVLRNYIEFGRNSGRISIMVGHPFVGQMTIHPSDSLSVTLPSLLKRRRERAGGKAGHGGGGNHALPCAMPNDADVAVFPACLPPLKVNGIYHTDHSSHFWCRTQLGCKF